MATEIAHTAIHSWLQSVGIFCGGVAALATVGFKYWPKKKIAATPAAIASEPAQTIADIDRRIVRAWNGVSYSSIGGFMSFVFGGVAFSDSQAGELARWLTSAAYLISFIALFVLALKFGQRAVRLHEEKGSLTSRHSATRAAVPFPVDSSASETPSSLGPRG